MYIDYKNRIFGLDAIRALAILLVIGSHSTLLLFPDESSFSLTIVRFFGAIGVDLFFVLSGYLIGTIILMQLKNKKTTFKHFIYFWIRRWFRTLPNYYLILLLNILLFYAFHKVIIDNISHYFIFTQNFFSPHPNFFTEAWSLSIEEYAYIIGPLLLFLLMRCFKKTDSNTLFLKVTIGIIVVVAFFRIYNHLTITCIQDYEWSNAVRKVVVFRIDSIYYGFLGAFLSINYSRLWRHYKRSSFYLGIVLFFGIHAFIYILKLNPNIPSLFFDVLYLPLVLISLLLLFPIFIYWNKHQVFKKQITTISILSYALYLINYSLVLLSIQYFIEVEDQSTIVKILILLLYWGVSFVLSYLLYRYFEKPIMNLRDSKFIRGNFLK